MVTRVDLPPEVPRLLLEFSYDYMGRRYRKSVEDTAVGTTREIWFIYDGWNMIREEQYAGPTGTLLSLRESAETLWGVDVSGTLQGVGGVGGLLSRNVVAVDGQDGCALYSYDANGNVSSLFNSDSSVAAHYEYTPFGSTLSSRTAFKNPFGYSTKYIDDETGFLYYGYRFYQPDTGRWISRDSIAEAGGNNLYGFVENTPQGGIDHLGMYLFSDLKGRIGLADLLAHENYYKLRPEIRNRLYALAVSKLKYDISNIAEFKKDYMQPNQLKPYRVDFTAIISTQCSNSRFGRHSVTDKEIEEAIQWAQSYMTAYGFRLVFSLKRGRLIDEKVNRGSTFEGVIPLEFRKSLQEQFEQQKPGENFIAFIASSSWAHDLEGLTLKHRGSAIICTQGASKMAKRNKKTLTVPMRIGQVMAHEIIAHILGGHSHRGRTVGLIPKKGWEEGLTISQVVDGMKLAKPVAVFNQRAYRAVAENRFVRP